MHVIGEGGGGDGGDYGVYQPRWVQGGRKRPSAAESWAGAEFLACLRLASASSHP